MITYIYILSQTRKKHRLLSLRIESQREEDREIDRDRETERGRQRDRQRQTETERQRETERAREIDRDRETDRQTDGRFHQLKNRDINQRETERQRDRETERKRERQTERQGKQNRQLLISIDQLLFMLKNLTHSYAKQLISKETYDMKEQKKHLLPNVKK